MFKIATYNVGCSLLTPAILAWARGSLVDVLLLQEVEVENKTAEYIKHLAGEYGYYVAYEPSRTAGTYRSHGLAILSRFPIHSTQVLELPQFNLGFHTRRRIALVAELQTPQGVFRACDVHLDSRLNITERLYQLAVLSNYAKNHPTQEVIIGGDFNTIPLALWKNIIPFKYVNQYKILAEYMIEQGFTSFFDKTIYSFRPRTLRWSLDGIYVRNLVIQDYGVERVLSMSDHIPLWVEIV